MSRRRPRRRRRHRRVQGGRAAAQAHRGRPRRHRRPDRGRAASSSAPHLGRAVAPPRRQPTSGPTPTTCRTCGSAAQADLVVVAPATADLLARAAHGLADDLLTNTLLTARCPVLFAPAMHTEMWEHPATVDNVATLRRRGGVVLEPAIRPADRRRHRQGPAARAGRDRPLAELLLRRPDALPPDLAGRHVVVSAGGTREPLDPVRFLGNASSGQAGLRARRGRRRPRRAGHAGRRERRACPTRPASTSSASVSATSCATRCTRPPRTPTSS